MLKKQRHCRTITAVPSMATTGAQIKLEFIANAVSFVESVYRSGAWGILYGKSSSAR